MWGKVRLNSQEPIEEILEYMNMFFQDNDYGLYPLSVQCEDPKDFGWLCYSIRGMSEKKISESIGEMIDEEVGGRYKKISLGYGSNNVHSDDVVKAIHLQASESRIRIVQQKMAQHFEHNINAELPLGVKVRFVPSIEFARNMAVKIKIKKLIDRQKMFDKHIKVKESSEIWIWIWL